MSGVVVSIHALHLIVLIVLFCFDGDPCFEFGKVVNGYVAMLTMPPPVLYLTVLKERLS